MSVLGASLPTDGGAMILGHAKTRRHEGKREGRAKKENEREKGRREGCVANGDDVAEDQRRTDVKFRRRKATQDDCPSCL